MASKDQIVESLIEAGVTTSPETLKNFLNQIILGCVRRGTLESGKGFEGRGGKEPYDYDEFQLVAIFGGLFMVPGEKSTRSFRRVNEGFNRDRIAEALRALTRVDTALR